MPVARKLTDAKKKVILRAVKNGTSQEGAAAKAGIHWTTLQHHIAQGKDQLKEDPTLEWAKFYLDYRKAELASEEKLLEMLMEVPKEVRIETIGKDAESGKIRKSTRTKKTRNPRTIQWLLERRMPDKYGPVLVKTTGPQDGEKENQPSVTPAMEQLAGGVGETSS